MSSIVFLIAIVSISYFSNISITAIQKYGFTVSAIMFIAKFTIITVVLIMAILIFIIFSIYLLIILKQNVMKYNLKKRIKNLSEGQCIITKTDSDKIYKIRKQSTQYWIEQYYENQYTNKYPKIYQCRDSNQIINLCFSKVHLKNFFNI